MEETMKANLIDQMAQYPLSQDLIKDFNESKVVFFIGAGFSLSSGACILDKRMIGTRPADEAGQHDGGETFTSNFLKEITKHNAEPSAEYRMLTFLIKKKIIKSVFTTNQDDFIIDALKFFRYKEYIKYDKEDKINMAENKTAIVKLCGSIFEHGEIALSSSQLSEMAGSNAFKSFIEYIKNGFTPVFIGYSFSDDQVANYIANKIHDISTRIYIVAPDVNKENTEKMTVVNPKVFYIKKTAYDFLRSILLNIDYTINIAHIVFSDREYGPIETYLRTINTLVEKLQKKNRHGQKPIFHNEFVEVECDYITPKPKNNSLEQSTFNTIMSLYDKCLTGFFDIIHSHDVISPLYTKGLRIPSVQTIYNEIFAEYASNKDCKSCLSGLSLSSLEESTSYIISPSPTLTSRVPEDLRAMVRTLKLPFDPAPFEEQAGEVPATIRSTDAFKRILETCNKSRVSNFDAGKKTFLFIGRPERKKGLEYAIKAFDMLGHDKNDIQLLLAVENVEIQPGEIKVKETRYESGSKMNSFSSYSVECAYSKNIFLVLPEYQPYSAEYRRELALIYKSADCVIIPSFSEPVGYVALEAAASGKLIICSNVGALPDILHSKRAWITIYPKNNKSDFLIYFFNGMRDIFLDEKAKERDILHDNCIAYINEEYGEDKVYDALYELKNIYLDAIIGFFEFPYRNFKICSESDFRNILYSINSYYIPKDPECSTLNELFRRCAQHYTELYNIYELLSETKNIVDPENNAIFLAIANVIKRRRSYIQQISVMPLVTLAILIKSYIKCTVGLNPAEKSEICKNLKHHDPDLIRILSENCEQRLRRNTSAVPKC